MPRLKRKVALVTGASSGIGRATAEALAREGAQVALIARNKDKLDKAVEDIGADATAFPADLIAPGAIEAVVKRVKDTLGPIDIVMANAGLYIGGDLVDTDPDKIDQLLSTNVNSVFHLVRCVLPGMIARRSGDILATSSVSGHQAIHWEPVYSASKHAIQSFMHGLRRQVAEYDIRALAIAPGIVLNELWGINSPDEIESKVAAGAGLKSEDVAEAVIFMLTRPRHVTIRDLVILPRTQPI